MKKATKYLLALIIALSSATSLGPFITNDNAYAGANQCTWTGGGADTNWSTAGNWVCSAGTVPGDGYDIIFPALGTDQTSVNDLSASNTYTGIWSTGSGSSDCGYTISGNDIQLDGVIDSSNNTCSSSDRITISANLVLVNDLAINGGSETGSEITISGDISLGTHNINVSTDTATLYRPLILSGVLTGSGNIITDGHIAMWGDSPAYSGSISIINGLLSVESNSSLGSTTGNTTIGNNANVGFGGCAGSSLTVSENFVYTGNGNPNMDGTKIDHDIACGGDYPADEYYRLNFGEGAAAITLDGTQTLNNDIVVDTFKDIIINGDLAGTGYTMNLLAGSGGKLIVNSSTNTSNTPDGVSVNNLVQTTISDSLPSTSIYVGARNAVTVTGARGDVFLTAGGALYGNGTIGALLSYGASARTHNVLSPGLSPGILTTGSLTFHEFTDVEIELEGTNPGEYDQFDVTGTVDLGDATLNLVLYNGYVPANIGDSYTIINNDSADAITGTFAGLSEGAEISVDAVKFTISYVGGDGNDVVLTVAYIPGPPGTGIANLGIPAVALYSAVALVAGIGLVLYGRSRTKRTNRS